MNWKAVGIDTGKVYATGTHADCVRIVNEKTHDEATKIIKENVQYTPQTEEQETERLAKEWQLSELREKERLVNERAEREQKRKELRETPPKSLIAWEAIQEASKPIVAPRKRQKRDVWSTEEEAYVKTNIDMPAKELAEKIAERFGKNVTDKAVKRRKDKLREKYGIAARPVMKWTQAEDDYIIKHYNRLTAEQVGKGIGRTKGSIQARVRLLRGEGKLDYYQRYEQKQNSRDISNLERSAKIHESGKHTDDRMGADEMKRTVTTVEKMDTTQIIKPGKADKTAMHLSICKQLNQTYQEKNADYGDSFGETYRKLGIISAVTRISDKTNRLISLAGKPEAERLVKDESITDTLLDLANYAIMTLAELEEAK